MKLLVVDDHPLFREGLRHVLRLLENQVDIEEATNFDEAVKAVVGRHDLDLILLDLLLPGMKGYDGMRTLRESAPDVPIVVISAVEEREAVLESFRHGAIGYIPKSSTSEVMLSALKLVLAGGKYLPPVIAGESLAPETAPASGAMYGAAALADAPELTRRQREVLELIGEGRSNKEIAESLGLAEGTVKIHVTAILKALKATNRTQAAMVAAQLGLVSRIRSGLREPAKP